MKKTPDILSNDELVELLFTEEDHLKRIYVDEMLERIDELREELASIVSDRFLWMIDGAEWWATLHATYILGAAGDEKTVVPLLSALRWSDAYDNAWVTEELPSIFGQVGEPAVKSLMQVVSDKSAGWTVRLVALDSLAAIALVHPDCETDLLSYIKSILKDKNEEHPLKRSAAIILLDFRQQDMREELLLVAHNEVRLGGEMETVRPILTPEDVERELKVSIRAEEFYLRNWLRFYDDVEISRRQRLGVDGDQKIRVMSAFSYQSEEGYGLAEGLRLCPCGSGLMYRNCCWEKLH